VRDERGLELFYNVGLTPWLHITPDLQVITPILARKIHTRSLNPPFRSFLSRWTKIFESTQNRWAQLPARGTKRQIFSRPGRSAALVRHERMFAGEVKI
jgi:inactivated superfamily I helicase